jgi:hypothetical protein
MRKAFDWKRSRISMLELEAVLQSFKELPMVTVFYALSAQIFVSCNNRRTAGKRCFLLGTTLRFVGGNVKETHCPEI